MEYEIIQDSGKVRLALSEELTFSDNTVFQEALDKVMVGSNGPIDVDLENLRYIDSAGLGLLVLLYEEACKRDRPVQITNVHGDVKRIMDVARFQDILHVKTSP